jgi:hypothetical protein
VEQISVVRLRLGVALIGIWWIPIWLLGPVVAGLTGQSVGSVTITVAIVQTVIGLIGALLAGRKIWHVLWTGKMADPEPTDATTAGEPPTPSVPKS